MGAPQTIEFTLTNNSVTTLSTGQMVEVGLLLGRKVQAAHGRARLLRSQIEAADTLTDVALEPLQGIISIVFGGPPTNSSRRLSAALT